MLQDNPVLTGVDESLGAEKHNDTFTPFTAALVNRNQSLRRVSVLHIAMPFTEAL